MVVVQGNSKRNNIHKYSFSALNSKKEFYNLVEHYILVGLHITKYHQGIIAFRGRPCLNMYTMYKACC